MLAGWAVLGGCSGTGAERAASAATSAPVVATAPAAASAPAPVAASTPAPVAAAPISPPAPGRASTADATVELRAQITRLIGSAACRNDNQCRALPLGSKPCGGPEGYLAWSTEGTDVRALEAAAERYKEARRARHERLGLMSDCAVVPEPAVRCVFEPGAPAGSAGQCRTQALQPGSRPGLR